MAQESKNPEFEPVAAVCGREVKVYGPAEHRAKFSFRPFWRAQTFRTYGAARLWAEEFNAASKGEGK
jgi:hypothetical protein